MIKKSALESDCVNKMPEIFFVGDTHFHHDRVRTYSCRPYSSVDEMNEALVDNWNRNVDCQDTVYHLGDFSLGNYQNTRSILSRLNGNIHLVRGNHDKRLIKRYGVELLSDGLFKSINYYYELKINHQLIVMSHYAFRVWNKSHYGSIHCYGHSHGTLPPLGRSVDVGVDSKEITPDYRPIHLDELFFYMKNKEFKQVDHHSERKQNVICY